MPHSDHHVPSVISDFVTSYVDSLISGQCRDDQYAVAFRLQRGGSLFLAVEPHEAVERDPRRLAPAELVPVAHAVFVPKAGRVSFLTPDNGAGQVRRVELEDPIYIRFNQGAGEQLWMLSLSEGGSDEDTLSVHRADPTTVQFQSCVFDAAPAAAFH